MSSCSSTALRSQVRTVNTKASITARNLLTHSTLNFHLRSNDLCKNAKYSSALTVFSLPVLFASNDKYLLNKGRILRAIMVLCIHRPCHNFTSKK